MFRNIVVPIDGSKPAKRASVVAIDLAKTYGSRLHFISVAKKQPQRISEEIRHYMEIENLTGSPEALVSDALAALLSDAERHARKKGVKTVKTATESGQPARAILSYAKRQKADLVVLGRRGLGELEGMLLGSVSHKVVSLADCPVLTVD